MAGGGRDVVVESSGWRRATSGTKRKPSGHALRGNTSPRLGGYHHINIEYKQRVRLVLRDRYFTLRPFGRQARNAPLISLVLEPPPPHPNTTRPRYPTMDTIAESLSPAPSPAGSPAPKKTRRGVAFYPNMNSSNKPQKPFSRSAAKRESVMALGSIEHLQHYFTKSGIAAESECVLSPRFKLRFFADSDHCRSVP